MLPMHLSEHEDAKENGAPERVVRQLPAALLQLVEAGRDSFINYVSGKFKREREANGSVSAQNDITEDLMQSFSVVNTRIQKGRIFVDNGTLPSILSIRMSNAKMELVTEMPQSWELFCAAR